MKEQKSAEQIIAEANRVGEFLADPIIAEAMSRMEGRFYEAFIASTSSEQRVTSWAQASVLRQFEIELRSTIDAGEMAVLRTKHTKS